MPEPQRGVYTPQGIPKPRAQVAQQPQPGSRTSSSQPTGGRQRASFSSEQGGQWMASSPRLGRGPAASSRAATRPKGSMVRTKIWAQKGSADSRAGCKGPGGSAQGAKWTRPGGRGDTGRPRQAGTELGKLESTLERSEPGHPGAALHPRPGPAGGGGRGLSDCPGPAPGTLYRPPGHTPSAVPEVGEQRRVRGNWSGRRGR